MKLKNIFIKNKELFQLIYGVFLIILMPILILFNSTFIIKNYNKSIDTSIQRQALVSGRLINEFVKNDLDNPDELNFKVKALEQKYTDILDIKFLQVKNDEFIVVAASKKDEIGKAINSKLYNVAWMEKVGDGIASDRLVVVDNNETPSQKEGRYWLVAMPMENTVLEKEALLSMKISSKIVDDITKQNRNASMLLSIFEIIIVIIFLSIAVRLWDYVLLYRKIKELDQMKDEFISIASHELRTPVTGIRGYSSMIIDGSLGEVNSRILDVVKMMNKAAGRLHTLVEDLLDVSRIEQGRMKIESSPSDVALIIKDIVSELKIQANEKRLYLKFLAHTETLPLLNIDKDRFKQILINLVGNAIKYTQIGGIEILSEQKEKSLLIKIKDTGIGMNAEERSKLFEKFYRVKNKDTKEVTGTGLGLWITKKITEAMGGKISVDSIRGVGTQIAIEFPLANNAK